MDTKRSHRVTRLFSALVTALIMCSCGSEEIPCIDIIYEGDLPWFEKEAGKIIYTESGETVELTGRIKCRGGMSSKYGKHSYALELDKKYELGGLPKDDDWIINATYIDKTFMRHKISYDIFRQMNPDNMAPRCAYVNVCHNGVYHGLYVLMEEVNGAMVGLDKKDTMAVLFKDPLVFYEERIRQVQDSMNYYQQKFPKIQHMDKNWYMEEFKRFLFYSSDEEFREEIGSWIDLESMVDWHILLLFSNSGDGLMKNFLLYKLNATTPFRFAIWDYDHSFGRDGDNEMNMLERVIDTDRAILFRRITRIPELAYMDKVKKRWFELRDLDIISEQNFFSMVKHNHRIIKSELPANFERWPVDGEYYYDDNGYKEEIDIMKQFVRLRIKQLDKYFNGI